MKALFLTTTQNILSRKIGATTVLDSIIATGIVIASALVMLAIKQLYY